MNLERQTNTIHEKCRRPILFQNIEAYAAHAVHVRVVDFCEKMNLGGYHRVLLGKKEFKMKKTILRAKASERF
jgi:hypothetical protein